MALGPAVLLPSSPSDLASKAFYSARTPTLLVDAAGVVVEFNAAARELLGLDMASCKGRGFSYLERQLRDKVEGSLFPPRGAVRVHFARSRTSTRRPHELVLDTDDLRPAVSHFRYRSDRFGTVTIRGCELPCVDTTLGTCTGSALSLEILEIEDIGAFREAIDLRLGHELMWEVYAASYDRVLTELHFYQEVVERHVVALQPDAIRSVLDVGAGTGTLTAHLLGLGKRVTAIDTSRAMLAKLSTKVKDECLSRLLVIEDTAERMPQLADISFDGVNVLLAFFDMQNPAAALREVQRVLRPGGTLVITEPRRCFDVRQLMSAAEASLRASGLLDQLAGDWKRIKVVAPLVRDAIVCHAQNTPSSSGDGWHAESILDRLERDEFTDLTFRESHLGNCATITGTKADR